MPRSEPSQSTGDATALAECVRCGLRAPLREVFSRDELLANANAGVGYVPMSKPCDCGGTIREDVGSTLAAVRKVVFGG